MAKYSYMNRGYSTYSGLDLDPHRTDGWGRLTSFMGTSGYPPADHVSHPFFADAEPEPAEGKKNMRMFSFSSSEKYVMRLTHETIIEHANVQKYNGSSAATDEGFSFYQDNEAAGINGMTRPASPSPVHHLPKKAEAEASRPVNKAVAPSNSSLFWRTRPNSRKGKDGRHDEDHDQYENYINIKKNTWSGTEDGRPDEYHGNYHINNTRHKYYDDPNHNLNVGSISGGKKMSKQQQQQFSQDDRSNRTPTNEIGSYTPTEFLMNNGNGGGGNMSMVTSSFIDARRRASNQYKQPAAASTGVIDSREALKKYNGAVVPRRTS